MWIAFVIEAIIIAVLTVVVYRYFASFTKHPPYVPILVLIGWYFGFSAVFLVPIDVASGWYDSCKQQNPDADCTKPIAYLESDTLLVLWRVLYWTLYILCWTIYPTMEAFSLAGGFSILEKLKSAIIANVLFYGLIGFTLLTLLIYIAAANHLNGKGMMGVAIAAANSWGLLLVILFSGFGLVEIPRRVWRLGSYESSLKTHQSQVVHIHEELLQAEAEMDAAMKQVYKMSSEIPDNDPWRLYIDSIIEMCPPEYSEIYFGEGELEATYANLVALSKRVKLATNNLLRRRCLYYEHVNTVFKLEDILQAKSQGFSGDRKIKWSFKKPITNRFAVALKAEFFEWLWKVWLQPWAFKFMALICFVMSVTLLWSEVTIASRTDPDPTKPEGPNNSGSGVDLSVWSLLIHSEALTDLERQIFVFIPMMYLAACVYYGLFRFRFFNIYRLLPHQQTDSATLLFCALYLGRLTAPMAFNFVTMIHNNRTAFYRMMGNMAVVPVLGTSLNTYLPIALGIVVTMTVFNLFSRISDLLHLRRFQFEGDGAIQLEEGMDLLKTERMKRERQMLSDSLPVQPLKEGRGPTFTKRSRNSEMVELEPELEPKDTVGGGGGGESKPLGSRDRLKERLEKAKERSRVRLLEQEGGKGKEKEKGSSSSSWRNSRGLGGFPSLSFTSSSSSSPSSSTSSTAPSSSSTSSVAGRLSSFFGRKSADNSLNEFVDDIESTASRLNRSRGQSGL